MARRFLAFGARAGDGHGYLSHPSRQTLPEGLDQFELADHAARVREATRPEDEPQGLDADEYSLHVDKRAKAIEEQRQKFESAARERERRLLSFEDRLVTAQAEARRRCIDVSSEIRLLRHMQTSNKEVRHLERRLGAVERKVWRELDQAA